MLGQEKVVAVDARLEVVRVVVVPVVRAVDVDALVDSVVVVDVAILDKVLLNNKSG